jgi:hypothetical protein
VADNQQLTNALTAAAVQPSTPIIVTMMPPVESGPGIIETVADAVTGAAEYVGDQVKPDPKTTQGTVMAGMWFALGGMILAPLVARGITWAAESAWDGLKGPRDWIARQIGSDGDEAPKPN